MVEVLGGLEELEVSEDGLKVGAAGQHNVLRALLLSQFLQLEGLLSFSPLTCSDWPPAAANAWQGMNSAREEPPGGNAVILTFHFIQNEGGKWRHGAVSQDFSSTTAK